jgi:competence protein ComEC
MPVSSWILLSVIVGSAAGATSDASVAVACVVTCLVIAWSLKHAGRVAWAAVIMLSLAAQLRATTDRWQRAHCDRVMLTSAELYFVTDFDVETGDASPAVLRAAGSECRTDALIRARVPVRGGEWYRTKDRAQPGGRSLSVRVERAVLTGERALRPTLRAAAVRRVDSVFTVDAAMARALLLADMHLIDPEIRTRWSRSGLVHMLSVSGMHVAIIAAALLMLGTALRLTRQRAVIVTLVLTAGYVTVLGLPPPAVRAGVMFGAVLLATWRQRPSSAWSVLTLGALIPVLVDSRAPLDLGWQLSVIGVVALAASARLMKRLNWRGGGWKATLRREVAASIIASVVSAPLVAWYFGTISLIAPLANIFAAPLIGVVQPTLFLAAICAPSLPVARFFAGASHPLLAMLDGVARTASAPSWAAVSVAPTLNQTLLGAGIIAALLCAMVQQQYARPLLISSACAALLLWHDMLPRLASGHMELHLLDVGQGDAIAIRTPHGHWILVDGGGGAPGVDQGRRVVLPYVQRYGGPVDAFVLSHPHLDHVGGAPALIGALRPAHYFDGAFAGGTEAYRASLESAATHKLRWQRVHPGDTSRIDGVLLRFLAPDSAWTAHLDDANLASTIVRVEYGDVAMLLVGDAELPEEAWLLEHTSAEWLRADVLKVGHHGSRTSSGAAFLDAVQPRLALISVGRGNRYGHPSPDVLQEFARRQVAVLRTDVAGTTVVRTDGRDISISTAARSWSLPFPAYSPGSSPTQSSR